MFKVNQRIWKDFYLKNDDKETKFYPINSKKDKYISG